MAELDNRTYYDDFANWYERQRGHGYHQLIDDLEFAVIEKFARGKTVLECGVGTGLLLERVNAIAASSYGVDLSLGMLAKAKERNLNVVHGSVTSLPFADATFDVVYSVKVLAHIQDIKVAMAEMARVTKPGGVVLAEFYNTHSLRYLIKRLKPPSAVSENTNDEAVFTRYDRISDIRSYLPPSLSWKDVSGIRVITPVSHVHNVPLLGSLVRRAEFFLANAPVTRQLGGFALAVCEKNR